MEPLNARCRSRDRETERELSDCAERILEVVRIGVGVCCRSTWLSGVWSQSLWGRYRSMLTDTMPASLSWSITT